MSHVLLLDTNVWSHLILGDVPKRTKMKADLAALLRKDPGAARATSGICVAECLVAARRLADSDAATRAEALFRTEFESADVMVVPVAELVLDRAATLRAQTLLMATQAGGHAAGADGGKLKLPDAIVAASCLEFDPWAVLVTENDKDFRYAAQAGLQTIAGLIVERVG